MRAFILAAGFGTRLKPITDHIPKALVPVCGRPLLERALSFCAKAGISAIGVNAHHLHDQIATYKESASIPFSLFHEDGIIRGTGGGLYFAREFLAEDDLFFVCNADIVYRFDLAPVVRSFLESDRIACLMAVPTTGSGSIMFDQETRAFTGIPVNGPHREGIAPAEFIGAALYRREFLDLLQPDDFSVVPVWQRIITSGCSIGVTITEGCYWRDVGTHASLAEAHFELLDGRNDLDVPEWLVVDRETKRCFHRDLQPASLARLGPYSWVETPDIADGVRISRSVVFAGSRPEQGISLEGSLLTPFGEVRIGN
jgi:mannose-1-phosphate guanylyltransferase